MNNKIVGSILLGASGPVATIGTAGAQIAYALVLSGFYAGNMTVAIPPGPQQASPHWIVVASTIVLLISGSHFLFLTDRSK